MEFRVMRSLYAPCVSECAPGKLNVMETIMLLDGSVDWKVGDPLCGALVNLPMALSMPGWPEAIFILIVAVLLFGRPMADGSAVEIVKLIPGNHR